MAETLDSSRYIYLGKNQYYDTQRKEIVERIGTTLRVVGFDRRRSTRPVVLERRKRASDDSINWIPLGNNLFFDKVKRVIMKNVGSRMVLYSPDRRKKSLNVAENRRKSA